MARSFASRRYHHARRGARRRVSFRSERTTEPLLFHPHLCSHPPTPGDVGSPGIHLAVRLRKLPMRSSGEWQMQSGGRRAGAVSGPTSSTVFDLSMSTLRSQTRPRLPVPANGGARRYAPPTSPPFVPCRIQRRPGPSARVEPLGAQTPGSSLGQWRAGGHRGAPRTQSGGAAHRRSPSVGEMRKGRGCTAPGGDGVIISRVCGTNASSENPIVGHGRA